MNGSEMPCLHTVPVLGWVSAECCLLAGWLNNWHWSMLTVICYLGVSVVLYSISLVVCKTAPDFREEEDTQ